MSFTAKTFITMLLALLTSKVSIAHESEHSPIPRIEILHWWRMPGEIKSLDEIAKAFTDRGGIFKSVTTKNFSAQRGRVLERISLGYPPAVAQWLGGNDLDALRDFEALQPLPKQWRQHPTEHILFPEVKDNISRDGDLWALPIGIHIHNTIYYSKAIYEQLELPLPTNWQTFLEQAPTIKAAGYAPLAVSDEPWQLQLVFNAILLEKAGASGFMQYYDDHRRIHDIAKAVEMSLSMIRQLRKFTDDDTISKTWFDSASYFSSGRAAAHINGDYVKPELVQAGLKAGVDFYCELAPGNQHMLYAFDVFAMMRVKNPDFIAGQELLFDTVMSPQVQASYNQQKGSIPVRVDVDDSQFDPCTKKTYRAWRSLDAQRMIAPSSANRLRRGAIEYATLQAWHQSELDVEKIASQLIKAIDDSIQIN